jgi:hypothetical protein
MRMFSEVFVAVGFRIPTRKSKDAGIALALVGLAWIRNVQKTVFPSWKREQGQAMYSQARSLVPTFHAELCALAR